MNEFALKTTIGDGPDQQVDKVLECEWTRVLQITLRNGKTLEKHLAREPITVQCISGEGVFIVVPEGRRIALTPGVVVPLEANIEHAVESKPAVSILVTRFPARSS